MPATTKTVPLLDDANLQEQVAAARAEQRSKREVILIGLVAFQTGILMALTFAGIYAYSQVMVEAQKLQGVTDLINQPELLFEANPRLAAAAAKLLRDTTTTFFLGSPNGTVAAFVEDMLETNFASVAAGLRPLSLAAANGFAARQSKPDCTQLLQCTMWGEVTCPNGQSRMCQYEGDVVNCGDCPFGEAQEISSTIDSVLQRVEELHSINPPADNAPAALSDGLLRMNSLLSWLQRQGTVSQWAKAATACDDFASQVGAVNWSGNYTDKQNAIKLWNANDDIDKIVKTTKEYCGVLKGLTLSAEPQQGTQQESASAGHRRHRHNARKTKP